MCALVRNNHGRETSSEGMEEEEEREEEGSEKERNAINISDVGKPSKTSGEMINNHKKFGCTY